MIKTKNFLLFFILFFSSIGCSYVPDWANPLEIYKDASVWISNPEKVGDEGNKKTKIMFSGSNKNFPKLVSVPSRPIRLSNTDRTAILNKLISDRKNAKAKEIKVKHYIENIAVLDKKPKPPLIKSKKVPLNSLPHNSTKKTVTPLPIPNLLKKNQFDNFDKRILDIIHKGPPKPTFQGKSVEQLTQLLGRAADSSIFEIEIGKRGSFINSDIIIATLLFSKGSARLTNLHRKEIHRIASEFRGKKGIFHITEHVNSQTPNLKHLRHKITKSKISYERARIVSRELVRQGIPDSLIRVTGGANSKTVNSKMSQMGKSGNHRVEIIFEKKDNFRH